MKLPKSIMPCSIAQAIVDVRFETKVPEEAVFGVIYQALETLVPAGYAISSPVWINQPASFYIAAAEPQEEAVQLAALENFAGKLLSEAIEPSQATIDLLNERFWDLV